MNTTLTRSPRRIHPHDEQPTHTAHLPTRRLGLVDRAALHLGMALIRWGRRPGRELARHERLANSFELGLLHRDRQELRAQLEQSRAHVLARLG